MTEHVHCRKRWKVNRSKDEEEEKKVPAFYMYFPFQSNTYHNICLLSEKEGIFCM